MTKRNWGLDFCLICICLTGCQTKKSPQVDFNRELPPGQLALRKISPAEYPDFSKCTWNLPPLPRPIQNAIASLNPPTPQPSSPSLDIPQDRALAPPTPSKEATTAASADANPGQYIDSQIRLRFD